MLQPAPSSSGNAEQNSSRAAMSVWEEITHYSPLQTGPSNSRAEKSTSFKKQQKQYEFKKGWFAPSFFYIQYERRVSSIEICLSMRRKSGLKQEMEAMAA